MSDPVFLRVGAAELELVPDVGGAVASFRFRDRDVLRPTGSEARAARNVRQYACYPLVPYSNRIAHATLRMRSGTTHALARNFGDHPHSIHGIGWQRTWQVGSHAATEATLIFAHRPQPPHDAGWPFAFCVRQHFALSADADRATLTMTLAIESQDSQAFPFGLGWHPFFPKPPEARLGFAAKGLWHNDATQLPMDWEALEGSAGAKCFEPPRALDSTALDHVYTGWNGRAMLGSPSHHVEVSADRSFGFLVVFVPPGRDFLALEPVTHMTDAFNRDASGARDTGARELAPGASWCGTMRILACTATPR